MALHQLANPTRKASLRRRANLEPEAAQNPAQAIGDVSKLRFNQLACGQLGANLLDPNRLAVHRPKPAKPDQLRNPARVVAIGLDRHRLEGIAHVPRSLKARPPARRTSSP